MNKINWANYNDEDFTLFCNALLTFEYGKNFRGFSAPGRDGGIDGSFEGTYSGISGLWRFQYKFRKGARRQEVNRLKSTVKSELAILKNESVFVLVTNLELLPQELEAFDKVFQTELARLKKNCICWVWDGTKILNLSLQFPILQYWLGEGFYTSQLQEYQLAFKKNLDREIYDLSPGTLNNIFVTRKDDFDKLKNFLYDDQIVCLISGEAGIGKTRLVLEFFKSIIDSLEQWSAVVLLNRHIDFDKIRNALSGSQNFIILIDDAHTYQPEIISDIKAICETASNKIKLILTARDIKAFKSLSLLKEYEKSALFHLKLNELSRAETEWLFMEYISGTYYENYIKQLVQISYGKPILIVAILNTINSGSPISQIRAQGFLRTYVDSYFNEYYQEVNALIGWAPIKTSRLMQNIALIEPFSFYNEITLQKICELHQIELQDLSIALKLLIDKNFVDGRYEQSIKPDYYSDILLSEVDNRDIYNYLVMFDEYLDNIIINLSSVEEIDSSKSNILEKPLINYSNSIRVSSNLEYINRVLSTISEIVYYRPEVAKNTIGNYLDCLKNENHIVYKGLKKENYYLYHEFLKGFNTIINLLSDLLEQRINYDFVFRTSQKLFHLSEDKNVSNVYRFKKRDAIDKFICTYQLYYTSNFSKTINNLTTKRIEFELEVFNQFLKLDYIVSEMGNSQRSITLITYYLPANEYVTTMREGVINQLTKLFQITVEENLRLAILKQLIDIPGAILATKKNKIPYQNFKEIQLVLNFLEQRLNEFSILEVNEIKEKLYWYVEWGISNDFLDKIELIKLKLAPNKLSEVIAHVIFEAENYIFRYYTAENHIHEKCDMLVSKNSKEELAKAIIEYSELHTNLPHYIFSLLNRLCSTNLEYSKELYLQLSEEHSKLFTLFAPIILHNAYFVFNDYNFYWNSTKILEDKDSTDLDNVLLSVYTCKAPGYVPINSKDTDLIIRIFNKKNERNDYILTNALQSLIVVKHPKALQVCGSFLERTNQDNADRFFLWLSDNKTADLYLIKSLVLQNTLKFFISHQIEQTLNLILIHFGIESLFTYFLERFEYKKSIRNNNDEFFRYEFVPSSNHTKLFTNCAETVKLNMFEKALDWFISSAVETKRLFFADDLLKYLQPNKFLSFELFSIYSNKITENENDLEVLYRIANSLSIFHTKNDYLLNLVIKVYIITYEIYESDPELSGKIMFECHLAITTQGVKSGTAGEPFPEDVSLQKLLKAKISNMADYLPATQFIMGVLKSVEKDINERLDHDNYKW